MIGYRPRPEICNALLGQIRRHFHVFTPTQVCAADSGELLVVWLRGHAGWLLVRVIHAGLLASCLLAA